MTEQSSGNGRKQLIDEIINRRQLGDKKFHSETSLQQYGDDDEVNLRPEKDPGVLNESINGSTNEDTLNAARRRTMSQPGPVSGSLLTATAARAARKRIPRTVNYADDLLDNKQSPRQPTPIKCYDDPDIISTTVERGNPFPYNGNYRNPNGDAKSLNSYRMFAPNEPRGASTPRKRSVGTMDAQSLRSIETQAPPPTSPELNKELTTENLTISLSCMYAILLVTLGVITFITDPFVDWNVATFYSISLTIVGFLYMFYLLFDIKRYKDIAKKNLRLKARHEDNIEEFLQKQDMDYGQMTPDERFPDTLRTSPVIPPPVLIPLKHDYCFSQGRHSGSFYLKLGAAGFALGHLVHSLLLIAVQMGYVFDENISNDDCVDIPITVLDFFDPLYCFFQLYFIFKFSNVIIMRGQGLARFGFMHFIGSSICFWLSAIVRETVLALTLYAQSKYANGHGDSNEIENTAEPKDASIIHNRFINVSVLYDEACIGSPAIILIYENFSPYLYPFSVEFNILIVAVYYIIWTNIGHCENVDLDEIDSNFSDTNTICKIPTATEENDFSSNIVIYADCHASNRGLFLGMVYIVFIVGVLILGFVFSNVGDEYLEAGDILADSMKLFLHVSMLIAAVLAFNQSRKLDINEHPISLLDDVLLYICLPAFFMESVFSMVATISLLNIIKTTDFVVMTLQVIIQTALIVDGLRRCSNSRKLRRKKPGRELVMFLLVVNVGMWIFNTFSYKSPESLDERYAYYGKVMWTILGHISLPLIMFYRFHSSVCFADMWNSAYKPGSDH